MASASSHRQTVRPADRGDDPALHRFAGDVRTTEPREGQALLTGQLAGQGLDLDDDLRGKKNPAAPVASGPPGQPDPPDKNVSATC